MSNGHAVYKNSENQELHLFIDVDLKTETICDFRWTGSLASEYVDEFEELKIFVLNHTLDTAFKIKRCSLKKENSKVLHNLPTTSLSLWLTHRAIEDFIGSLWTLNEQKDFLCLCYGIGLRDLTNRIKGNPEYDLSLLIADTQATSACGSCKSFIQKAFLSIREENGLILGLNHSNSRLDKAGHWIKIKGLYPAELLIQLEALKIKWMEREGIIDQFSIEIVNIEGYHIGLKVDLLESSLESSLESTRIINETQRAALLTALRDFWRSEFGALFFLHLSGF
jgi:hypothetical protein